MKIELATIQDVPELQELQRKSFGHEFYKKLGEKY